MFMIIRLKFPYVVILLLFLLCSTCISQSIVETVPGYPGPLPFELETGYIGLDEDDDVQLFYYFIESERDPANDPLVLWLTGGPGCSSFSALFYEIGPLNFDDEASEPKLVLNPYSWTKLASIILVDSPPGTGFSYATTSKGYDNSDTKVAEQLYIFLQKWLLNHPSFRKNRLYISGDSYGGMWVPMVVWKILKGNEVGDKPDMALEGYCIGNPKTDSYIDENTRVTFAHRLSLISDEFYKMAKINCKGNYVNPDPTSGECLHALQKFEECTQMLNEQYILEPCYSYPSRQEQLGFAQRFLGESSTISRPLGKRRGCRDYFFRHLGIWVNDPTVQNALQVRKGAVQEWERCSNSLIYEYNVESVIPYHRLLTEIGLRVLVYSGDHDMTVSYIGTLEWIRQLNLTLVDHWRPWFLGNEVGGYTERYANTKSGYNLTFATVMGAGHIAPEYKRKECQVMFERFVSHNPL